MSHYSAYYLAIVCNIKVKLDGLYRILCAKNEALVEAGSFSILIEQKN